MWFSPWRMEMTPCHLGSHSLLLALFILSFIWASQEVMADSEFSFTHRVCDPQPVYPHFLSHTCILLTTIYFCSLNLITKFAPNQRHFYISHIKKLCSCLFSVLIVIAPADWKSFLIWFLFYIRYFFFSEYQVYPIVLLIARCLWSHNITISFLGYLNSFQHLIFYIRMALSINDFMFKSHFIKIYL